MIYCRINGCDFKVIVMVFYKVVLKFVEGFVFNFIKDIVLLIDKKRKLVIFIVLFKVCDGIIMLFWLKKLFFFG